MQIITTLLNGGWEVAERSPAQPWSALAMTDGDKNWLPAVVPGHVHLDLVRAGVIADPYWRMQERGCQWVDWTDWTYRTTFAVDGARLTARGAGGRHFLHFHGLDTVARVYLNGTLVGAAEDMFIAHRFDVTDTVKEGPNELRVEFDAALRVGQERATQYLGDGTSPRGRQHYFNFAPRAFVRKAQYMFGWDWGPELVSCGIWKPVELITVPAAEITDWRCDYVFTADTQVDIDIVLTVTKYDDRPVLAAASLFAAGDTTPSAPLEGGPGTYTVTLPIRNFRCERWAPHAGGDPTLHRRYLLNLKLFDRSEGADDAEEPALLHLRGESVGFRTVELIHAPDPDGGGESFTFRINGVDTFMKGANWIPDSSFPASITRQQLRQRLTQARDAGFNMLRVWGGGLYESDDFYQLCSELGILVWQDFPLACSMYPDDEEWFVERFREEAAAAVRRLRSYPCLALWCGGNENLQLAQQRWAGPDQATAFYGDRLIHETLPAVLAAEDPRTPYLPNSPYSFGAPGVDANSDDYGDSHYWRVWHAQSGSTGDWAHYAESTSRFSSEFGFASPCGRTAWESCSLPRDREPRSEVARWHDKTRKGYETYLGFIERHYPKIQTFDDLIYYGQANQADALKFGIEHWRRLKGRCWGTLFWQLNDCWPVQSWATVDSAGEPKAAQYAAKGFFAPLLLSLVRDGDTVAAHLVNDTLTGVPGTVTLRVLTFTGEELARAEAEATAPANAASGAVLRLPLSADVLGRAAEVFVHAAFTGADGATLGENLLLLADPKDLRLPDPGLTVAVETAGDGRATLTVSAERFAGYVWLGLSATAGPPADFSDNWFHLLPGASRTVTVTNCLAGLAADDLSTFLSIRHL